MTETVAVNSLQTYLVLKALNDRAPDGMTCTAVTRRRFKTVLTFETAPADAPLCIWQTVPWGNFCQPAGWDYALADDTNVYYTRPLPPGTVAVCRTFGPNDTASVAAFLTEQAAAGLHLVAAWRDLFYFTPAPPASLCYTVTHAPPNDPAVLHDTMMLCNAVRPDAANRYFIACNGSLVIHSDTPGLAPAHEGRRVPFDLCRDRIPQSWRPVFGRLLVMILGLAGLTLTMFAVLFLLPSLDESTRGLATLLLLAGMVIPLVGTPVLAWLLRTGAHKAAARLSPDAYPKRLSTKPNLYDTADKSDDP